MAVCSYLFKVILFYHTFVYLRVDEKALGGRREYWILLNPLQLEWQAVVSYPVWVLGTELGCSNRVVQALTNRPSLQPWSLSFVLVERLEIFRTFSWLSLHGLLRTEKTLSLEAELWVKMMLMGSIRKDEQKRGQLLLVQSFVFLEVGRSVKGS